MKRLPSMVSLLPLILAASRPSESQRAEESPCCTWTCRSAWVGPFARAALLLLLVGISLPSALEAQLQPPSAGSSDVGLLLRQLDGEKRVLMIAAHPDDEDTSLLAALARGQGVRTAYLSLSRGEGGQNLIGPELDEGLGIIRSGELLSARSVDGAEQYFARAFDFGFSKSADETFGHWPREELLRDMVWVIRHFRPHVVVSIFTGTSRDGHGHHQASGIVAPEAFEVAGDPDRFPDQLEEGIEPWTPLKFYRSTRFRAEETTLAVPTGTLDPLLGRSHFQVAMESRSRHRSQDMGAPQTPGPRNSGLELIVDRTGEWGGVAAGGGEASEPRSPGGEGEDGGGGGALRADEDGIFAGVDTTLSGLVRRAVDETEANGGRDGHGLVEATQAYRSALNRARSELRASAPASVSTELKEAREALNRMMSAAQEIYGDSAAFPSAGRAHRGELRRVLAHRDAHLSQAALAASGVIVDLRVDRSRVVPGEELEAEFLVWNGGSTPVVLSGLTLHAPAGWSVDPRRVGNEDAPDGIRGFFAMDPSTLASRHPTSAAPVTLGADEMVRWRFLVEVPADAEPSRLYYLAQEREGSLYRWPEDRSLHALPADPPLLSGEAHLRLDQVEGFRWTGAAHHVDVDKALGEYRVPLFVVPALSVELDPGSMVWPESRTEPRDVTVRLTNEAEEALEGEVTLEAPSGWQVEPTSHPFHAESRGGEVSRSFRVSPGGAPPGGVVELRAGATTTRLGEVREYGEGVRLIDYPHLDPAPLYRDATLHLSSFPVQVTEGLRVGYIQGPGDEGPRALRDLGVEVELLDGEAYRTGDLDRFHTLVLGIRAYETRDDLWAANERLLEFARRGGTVIVNYNKYEYPDGGFAPYPLAMRRPHHRVTDPEAPVRLLDPDHPVLSRPNRIDASDFEGWRQERGLYFLSEWDDQYTPLLEMADPGEEPNRGSLVVARVGDGAYVYTGLSLFRQFPRGVPGAFRLLANLVSLRGDDLAAHVDGADR
jgi:LmbE family N-acetylglucosaminyl deacetylase